MATRARQATLQPAGDPVAYLVVEPDVGLDGHSASGLSLESRDPVARRLAELAAEFAGWRFGRGGSGNWWAVRGNDLIRSLDVEDLRTQVLELRAPGP